MKTCNKNLLDVLEYAHKLLEIADKGDDYREDAGCGVLYGIVRDHAYSMKRSAEREIESHKNQGKWDEELKFV